MPPTHHGLSLPLRLFRVCLLLLAFSLCAGCEPSPKSRSARTIGLETLGGVFTPIIPAGHELPTEVPETFSTAADNQSSIEVAVFSRPAGATEATARVLDATLIGRYRISGFGVAPRGIPKVRVVFRLDREDVFSLSASEGHRPLTVEAAPR